MTVSSVVSNQLGVLLQSDMGTCDNNENRLNLINPRRKLAFADRKSIGLLHSHQVIQTNHLSLRYMNSSRSRMERILGIRVNLFYNSCVNMQFRDSSRRHRRASAGTGVKGYLPKET